MRGTQHAHTQLPCYLVSQDMKFSLGTLVAQPIHTLQLPSSGLFHAWRSSFEMKSFCQIMTLLSFYYVNENLADIKPWKQLMVHCELVTETLPIVPSQHSTCNCYQVS